MLMASSENGTSSQGAATIYAIDSKSIQKITSSQVVVDLQTAVKELVENSLDAGATAIDVKFKNYGLESFEVSDNGTGIREEDLDTVGLNHHTSKLSSFDDLAQVTTFGFRGEALSSLCALAKVTVQSATGATEPRGWMLEFDKMGKVTSKKTCSRPRGTTVNVQSLFHNLPVRRKQFSKDYKKHFAHAQTWLQAYGLISTNLSLNVSNHPAKGSKTFQFQTKGNSQIKQNFSNIFTPKACNLMIDLELSFNVHPDRTVLRSLGLPLDSTSEELGTSVSVKGLMSRPAHGQGRNAPDRQFYFINGRPFTPSKISKCVNEAYKQFNTNQYPVIVANFILPPDCYDLNIDPNKRSIFLHSEGNLIEALREALDSFCQPYRSTFSASQLTSTSNSFLPQSLKLTLTQPTLSKRKNSATQPAGGTSDQDQLDSNAVEIQHSDSLNSPDHKRAKLRELSASLQDANTADLPSAVSASHVTLFKASSPSPPPETLADNPPSLQCADPGNLEPDVSASEVISPLPPAPVAENSPEPSLRKDSGHESDSGRSQIASTSQVPLDKPDWVPSILRDPTVVNPKRMVQMTLSTSGASWNTKVRASHSTKGVASQKKKAVSSSERMRSNIQHFTLGGHTKPARPQSDQENDDDELVIEEDQLSPLGIEDELDDDTHERDSEDRLSFKPLDPIEVPDEQSDDDQDPQRPHLPSSPASPAIDPPSVELRQTRAIQTPNVVTIKSQSSSDNARRVVREKEIIPSRDPAVVKLSIQLEDIVKVWEALKHHQSAVDIQMKSCSDSELQGAGLNQSEAEAETTLSRNVQKTDFEHMEIIGQFNLGFIIVRRREENNSVDDLFIVDQHASDEKFNFEKLQRETKLTGQRLLIPKVLDLTAAEEITVMDHLDLLELNGFSVQVDESARVGGRVHLLAQPVSGNTSWGVSDLEELLHLINERGSNEVVRPSKTRRMFASRACRMSTMIGDGLTTKQMSRIVKQMGTMDQPWACPHGRPTMRWLARCDGNPRQSDPRYRISNWITGKLDF
ncbi:hypothetical protein MJO28_005235 [Puccinia striiformis f. sp. tritici]|uniref:Uncharacterized protein n=1 Tax=Puccinia striiformis f. sp. tritici TaxID=168172 RepID=A0ACC0EK55_9BASI|nr:hypothetical protein Pst134EB_010469 [Puccinia striiformis f. sp. tritici]KAI7954835.1 hypothetical protein MJO28_005235 [Puccinia striiformis f. sp. tritici]KAI7960218.1 hypothetical protein MJO29_005286 [Puccinia striiformis f. sp. tritici]KAI9630770.1 hypothetical protein KEM48_013669 [Puccinia striiformis f. sp. tritici PST-130]